MKWQQIIVYAKINAHGVLVEVRENLPEGVDFIPYVPKKGEKKCDVGREAGQAR